MNAKVDSSSYMVAESNSPNMMRQKMQSLSCGVMDLSCICPAAWPRLARFLLGIIYESAKLILDPVMALCYIQGMKIRDNMNNRGDFGNG